jgi:hypothetical protein
MCRMFGNGQATAVVVFILVCSALLTVPTAAFVLWLYGRSVRRAMTKAARQSTERLSPPVQFQSVMPSNRLTVQVCDPKVDTSSEAFRKAQHSLRQAVVVYGIAGIGYALPFAMAWSLQIDGNVSTWRRTVELTGIYYWPTVLAILLLAATSRTEGLKIQLMLFAAIAAFSLYELAVSPKLTAGQVALLWVITNGLPTMLIAALLLRKLRAVGPIIFAFMLVVVTGTTLAPYVAFGNQRGMLLAIKIGSAVGLGGTGVFYAAYFLGFVCFALPAYWLLRYMGDLYRRKQLSDQSVMLDALYFIFAVEQSIGLDPRGKFVFTGLVSFLGYKTLKWIGFRYLRSRRTETDVAPVLLVLRVFSLGARSEKLFDSLTKWWRRAGSIVMIAGPDLIKSTIQPHEFLEFIGGRTSRGFVSDEADLAKRVAAIDVKRDPDGRFRINQFFCHPDSWQMTMRELARHSSVVLMDLRSFSPSNQGCVYELEQILKSVDLRRVVFVADSSTDRAFLEQTLQRLWTEGVFETSPNARVADPRVQLFMGQVEDAGDLRRLIQRLLLPLAGPAVAE